MAEINLLEGNARVQSNGSAIRIVLNVVGCVVLLAVAGFGVFFYLQVQKVQADDAATVASQASVTQSIVGDQNYKNFIATQKSLSALTTLFTGHLAWTSLIPNLSTATLKTASFTSFNATSAGGVDISGTVPSFADLDEMMQGFQLQQFSSLIKSVSLVSVGLSHTVNGNSVSFSIHVQVDPSTLKYEKQ